MKLIDIAVTRIITAPAAQVYDVWIDPKCPGCPWYGAERAIVNPAVDGLYYFAVLYQSRIWAHYGRFTRLDKPHTIEYTWMSEATKGLESLVTTTFTARGNQTEVKLVHSGVPDDELGRQHEEGWTAILKALGERLEARSSASGAK